MDLPPFDSISKIWAPSLDDLRKFCDSNKYIRQELRGDQFKNDDEENEQTLKIEQPENPIQVLINGDLPISCFLYYVVKKSEVSYFNDITKPRIHFMEEEALVLCGMLKREGFLGEESPETTDEQDCCITCATEKLEKDLMETAQREMEIIALARKYYTLPENESKYNICGNHRPFQPKNCVPRGNGINIGQHSSLPGTSREEIREQNKNILSDQPYYSNENAYFNPLNKTVGPETYVNAQSGQIRSPLSPRIHYEAEQFLNNLGGHENNQYGTQSNHFAPQFCPSAPKFAPEQSLDYVSNFINPQIPTNYLFEPETYNNYQQTNEINEFTALFQKCILGQEHSHHNLTNNILANQSSNYFLNNFNVNGQNRLVDHAAQSFQNRVPSNCPNYGLNRGINQNSTNHFGETLNTRQNEINVAVNTITRDYQHQSLLSGNRVGRKILGKRY